jgi:hypothetical protein
MDPNSEENRIRPIGNPLPKYAVTLFLYAFETGLGWIWIQNRIQSKKIPDQDPTKNPDIFYEKI